MNIWKGCPVPIPSSTPIAKLQVWVPTFRKIPLFLKNQDWEQRLTLYKSKPFTFFPQRDSKLHRQEVRKYTQRKVWQGGMAKEGQGVDPWTALDPEFLPSVAKHVLTPGHSSCLSTGPAAAWLQLIARFPEGGVMPLPSFSARDVRSWSLSYSVVSYIIPAFPAVPQGFQKVIWGDFIKCKMFLDITGAMM